MERVALPLSNESLDETVKVLKALADPTRLRLIQLLLETTPGKALCVNALAARLKVSQPQCLSICASYAAWTWLCRSGADIECITL